MKTSKIGKQYTSGVRPWLKNVACLSSLIPGTGNGELMYSGNPLENSKWRSKEKKGSKRNNLGKGEFLPAVPPDGQYVLVRAASD